MIALIQRVSEAAVRVDDQIVGQIGPGLLALIGIARDDTADKTQRLLDKLLGYRIFSDDAGKINRSLKDTGGGLLLVSQFTLAADTGKGTRPSFTSAAAPDIALQYFDQMISQARAMHHVVEAGVFGADMKVSLINDGPVTFWLEV